jgi:hypothetical protein
MRLPRKLKKKKKQKFDEISMHFHKLKHKHPWVENVRLPDESKKDANSTHKAIIWFSVLKYDESRQSFYSVFISNARVLLGVDLHHQDLIFQLRTDFLYRCTSNLLQIFTILAKPKQCLNLAPVTTLVSISAGLSAVPIF